MSAFGQEERISMRSLHGIKQDFVKQVPTKDSSILFNFEMSLWQVWSGITGLDQEEEEEEEEDEKYRYDYQDEYKRFHFTPDDVASLVEDDAAFRRLQQSLRKRKCVTNDYLKQTMHSYVKRHKNIRAFREAKQHLPSATSSHNVAA